MKLLCPLYLSCDISDCPHKMPHYHRDNCDRNCDGTSDSKCEATLKAIREEKLKKINESNLHTSKNTL